MNPTIRAIQPLYSANSKIFIESTGWDFSADPGNRIRWCLFNSNGDVVWFKEADWHETDDAADIGYVDSFILTIPAFPQTGGWQLKLGIRGPILGIFENVMMIWAFNVGESSIQDNFLAPIYITWEGIVAVHWGEFSLELPALFLLSSPIWGFAFFIVALAIWRGSFKLAIKELEKIWNVIKKKKKNGGKKDVEKTKIKKSAG